MVLIKSHVLLVPQEFALQTRDPSGVGMIFFQPRKTRDGFFSMALPEG